MNQPRREPTTRRLFFALWPDSHTRRTLQRETRPAVRYCGGRAVPVENYHLTLAFLGNVDAQLFGDIVSAAAGVSVPVMDLALDCYGHWDKPRVFWMGLRRCPAQLTRLSRALWGSMEPLGLLPDRRIFRPHITLCRKVRVPPRILPPAPIRWSVKDAVLVESETGSGRANYTVVARFAAGSSSDPQLG
jgi:2'-5' RNA ligase